MAYPDRMDRKHEVAGHLDDEWLSDLDRVCRHLGISREEAVTSAILRFVNDESHVFPNDFDHLPRYVSPDPLAQAVDQAEENLAVAYENFLRPARDQADAGETISHEDLMAELKQLDDAALAERRKHAA